MTKPQKDASVERDALAPSITDRFRRYVESSVLALKQELASRDAAITQRRLTGLEDRVRSLLLQVQVLKAKVEDLEAQRPVSREEVRRVVTRKAILEFMDEHGIK